MSSFPPLPKSPDQHLDTLINRQKALDRVKDFYDLIRFRSFMPVRIMVELKDPAAPWAETRILDLRCGSLYGGKIWEATGEALMQIREGFKGELTYDHNAWPGPCGNTGRKKPKPNPDDRADNSLPAPLYCLVYHLSMRGTVRLVF